LNSFWIYERVDIQHVSKCFELEKKLNFGGVFEINYALQHKIRFIIISIIKILLGWQSNLVWRQQDFLSSIIQDGLLDFTMLMYLSSILSFFHFLHYITFH